MKIDDYKITKDDYKTVNNYHDNNYVVNKYDNNNDNQGNAGC